MNVRLIGFQTRGDLEILDTALDVALLKQRLRAATLEAVDRWSYGMGPSTQIQAA